MKLDHFSSDSLLGNNLTYRALPLTVLWLIYLTASFVYHHFISRTTPCQSVSQSTVLAHAILPAKHTCSITIIEDGRHVLMLNKCLLGKPHEYIT